MTTAVEQQGRLVELISGDKQSFSISERAAKLSGLISDMLEEDDNDDGEIPSIPLPNVSGSVLGKVVDFMIYHIDNPMQDIEKPLKGKIEEFICQWDIDFLNIDSALLTELVMATNYLNIKPLLDLTCAKIASMIKGQSPEVSFTIVVLTSFSKLEKCLALRMTLRQKRSNASRFVLDHGITNNIRKKTSGAKKINL